MFYAQLSEINWEFHGKTIDTICVNWYYYRAVRTDLNSSWRQIDDYVILIIGSVCGNSSAVEHRLAKAGVASSNLVSRSNFIWRHSQAVRQRSAKPLFPSSILGAASTNRYPCRGGGTGRRNGLKIRRLETTVPVRFRSSAPIKTNFG